MEGLLVIRPYPFIGRGDFAAARIDMTEGPTLSPVSMDRDNQRRQLHCEDGAEPGLAIHNSLVCLRSLGQCGLRRAMKIRNCLTSSDIVSYNSIGRGVFEAGK